MNFKTVQSFGYEHLIVEKYKEMLAPINKTVIQTNIKIGLAFGMSQFAMYTCMAAMFYFAGILLENINDIDQEDVFKALFAIMFGAW